MKRKLISIISSCFNEENNLWELYNRTTAIMNKFPQYDFEHILADNGSTDNTYEILRNIAEKDKRYKIIVNTRNFGPDRSMHNVGISAKGDCIIALASDLQEPPELLEEFIKKWEKGYKIVIGVKHKSKENCIKYMIRTLGYFIMKKLTSIDLIPHYTGFGLCDRVVHDMLVKQEWPVPFTRGMISEIGFERAEIQFIQPKRKYGKSSYSLFKLYDAGMSGVTSYSKTPLRIASFIGVLMAICSMIAGMIYLVIKLLYWDSIPVGIAPMMIGIFFLLAIQFIFIGLLGEYILSISQAVYKRPLVVEKERIGFDDSYKE